MKAEQILGRREDVAEILRRLNIKEGDPLFDESSAIRGDYNIITANKYSKCLKTIRSMHIKGLIPKQPLFVKEDGIKIVRPFSVKETIEARVHQFHSDQERGLNSGIWSNWIVSCSAIAYAKNIDKFKFIPICQSLIELQPKFEKSYIDLEGKYDSLEGIEFEYDPDDFPLDMSKADVLNHPLWIEAVEGDKELLREYADIIVSNCVEYGLMGPNILPMGLHLYSSQDEEMIRPVTLESGEEGRFCFNAKTDLKNFSKQKDNWLNMAVVR